MDTWSFRRGPRGLVLRICEWGRDRPGLPLVILHGFLEQGAAWEPVARLLHRRVLAPDQRGHGRSGHVGSGGAYHFWDYVGDLDALVEHLGAPIDLVGHSMGGTVAALYAGTRPEAVRKLALVEGLGPPDATENVVARARAFLDALRQPPRHGALPSIEAAVKRMMRAIAIGPDVARSLAERTLAPSEDGARWTWDPLHRGTSPVPFQTALFVRFLAEITAPVLLVDGETSTFSMPDDALRVASLRNAVTVTIPGAGHLVHHDAPTALAAELSRFLEAA